MVESLDRSVGQVLGAIDRAGVAERTMVMFFSDNGGLLYEGKSKTSVTDNSPLRAGKGHLYEGGIREPLIVRFPGVVKAGRVIDTPVSSVDFAPTMCDVAGVSAGDVDGVSLMPLLRGVTLPARPLFWHYPHYSNQGGEPASAIREGDWKLIEFHQDGRRELFNLREDISETRNLVEKEAARARRMAAALDAWRKKSGAVMPVRNPAADPAWEGWGLTGAQKPTPVAER
jgi:arylsulfatase A-like enzyme